MGFTITQLTQSRVTPIIESEFKTLGGVIKLGKRGMMKRTAIPVILSASLIFSGVGLSGTTVLAGEQDIEAMEEGISKEDAAYLFLQKERSGNIATFSKKSVEQQLETAKSNFQVIDNMEDKETDEEHFRTVEVLNGVPVYGSGQTVAVNNDHQVSTYFGNVSDKLNRSTVSTDPDLSDDNALDIVKEDIESDIGEVEEYDSIDAKLVLYPEDGDYSLTYYVKASTSEPVPGYFHYFVDAMDGHIINDFDALHKPSATVDESRKDSFPTADEGEEDPEAPEMPDPEDPDEFDPADSRGIDIFGNIQEFTSAKSVETGKYYLYNGAKSDGIHTFTANRMPEMAFIILSGLLGITGFEIESNSNFFYDPAAVSAHINAEKVYDYYDNVFDRDSLDDEGMKLISTVHVGSKWNNAAWNGKQMMYGDGDGNLMISTSGSLDVIGHEMTHGVIEHTAGLIYEDESGALNESLADIMGAFIEDKEGEDLWLLGEDIYMPSEPGVGLRDMKNPASMPMPLTETGFYPDHYDDRYLGEEDNGGVHINSSINNKAAHLITAGGTHYDVTVEGIGKNKAEKIFYRTITHYLSASSDFSDMRQAAIDAAQDLYGEDSSEVETVREAYRAVGVE